MKKGFFTYENGVVTLMALTFGCLFFDRLALNFLIPFVAKDLNLTDTHIGILAGALSLTWAVSGYFTTAWAENNNQKKIVFVVAIILFSLCSFGSGLSVSFITLLLARLVMGLSEGAVIPLAQNFVERVSSVNRLGLNFGLLQAVGSALFGSILAPVVLVNIAENFGWRNAFFVAGFPGLLMGVLAWKFLRKSTTESVKTASEEVGSFKILWDYHNVRYGIGLACCIFGWWFATLPFITKYFVNAQGMSPAQMGSTMGLLGVSGLFSAIIVPSLSDRFGRKPILYIFVSLGIFYPLSVIFLHNSTLYLPALFITYFMMGCIPIVAAVIPSESVPEQLRAKAMGLIMGIGEIVGGVLVPAVAGILSDVITPSAFLWVSFALATLAIGFIFKLKETVF